MTALAGARPKPAHREDGERNAHDPIQGTNQVVERWHGTCNPEQRSRDREADRPKPEETTWPASTQQRIRHDRFPSLKWRRLYDSAGYRTA
jgi:hypothetical protein